MHPSVEVEISDLQGHMRVDPAALEDLVRLVLARLGRDRASISIALVDNAAIHALNRTHLGHDWPTDVISFPLSAPDDSVLAGELVVSAEMASATARELGVAPGDELALYVVHGLLHLCGFDDHQDADCALMREHEAELLARVGLANPHDKQSAPGALGGKGTALAVAPGVNTRKLRLERQQAEGHSWTG